MAWQKIPRENHPVFYAALPEDPQVETVKMFGGLAGLVNGHMFSGLWADTVVVRLSEKDRDKVLSMPGGSEFDPMGRGRPMKEMVLLPKEVLAKKAELRRWLKKALTYTAVLPPKVKKAAKKKPTAKTATAKKAPAKKAPAKKAPAKKAPAKKR